MAELTETRPIQVVVVDDHPVLREGTRAVLEQAPDIKVVGTAGEGAAALQLVEEHRPDVLLLDLRLPDVSGVAVAQRVRAWYPEVAVLVLTGYDDVGYIRALLQLGIQGYLRKTVSGDEIVAAVRAVAAGQTVPMEGRTGQPLGATRVTVEDGVESLSRREKQVLDLLVAGQRNQEIADMLGLSVKGIEFHVKHLLQKLGARSRTEAIVRARERGWVELGDKSKR